jgi:hypothetical protein
MKDRVIVRVLALEFQEGGNTIWIQGPQGGTTLRIKTMGKVTSSRCDTSPISHGDIVVQDDIHICIGAAEFSPSARALEKQASRDADAAVLASGKKTVAHLRAENSAFAFPRDRIRLKFPKRER